MPTGQLGLRNSDVQETAEAELRAGNPEILYELRRR